MATYAIGDIQGCYRELLDLLERINFDENNDRLWFTGDLVNRGPESLRTLRFVKNLNGVTVLGNHDLHLLAIAAGAVPGKKTDTLDEVLQAPDRDELLAWLQQLPLLHHDAGSGFTLVHAGLPPQWDLPQAMDRAGEVEAVLRGDQASAFFSNMYGSQPDHWSEALQGWERLRFTTNCLTRLRYCDPAGKLILGETGPPGTQPPPYLPWFQVESRKSRDLKIIFGHWATIHLGNIGDFRPYNVYPLDTGCVWGRELTALKLENAGGNSRGAPPAAPYLSVPSRQKFQEKSIGADL